MTGAGLVVAAWVGFGVAAIAALLWVANRDTLAELPDSEPHWCLLCGDLDDTLAVFDFQLWGIELEADAP